MSDHTVREIYDSMSEEQKQVVAFLVRKALEAGFRDGKKHGEKTVFVNQAIQQMLTDLSLKGE